MNNYLEIELIPNSYGGGSFYCKADFKLDNFKTSFQNIDVKCEALKFKHSITDFMLNGVSISTQDIFLNYNRSGNILIGVDILQTMVGHWDISKKTGKLLLLCCPRNLVDYNFYNALKEHFGLKPI